MPANRPTWKGQLRLSLVSIDVELFTATKSSAKPSFRQIHEPTGKPIHYEKVVDGVGKVDPDDIMKGFEYEKGDYVLLTDDEIDAVKLETKRTLELVQFVDEGEIPPLYFDAPYFMAPRDELAEDAFRVIRDALRQSKKVGLGQLALRGQEYLVAVRPCGKGMLLETLHYSDEIKKSDSFFSEIPAKSTDPELLDVAGALIERKSSKFDPAAFKNHYHAALRELIARKLKNKGKKITAEEEEPKEKRGSNVIDLMAALKQSLEGGKGSGGSSKSVGTAKRSSTAKKAPPKRKAPVKAPARKKAS